MKSGIYKTLDWLVLAVCILFYIVLIVFLITPVGRSFFEMFKNWMPFIEMVEGTLSDINKFFGLIFQRIGLAGALADGVIQNYPTFTLLSLLHDMSKLLLSGALQSLLFWFFSVFFLRAKESGFAWMQFIGSGLYAVNHFLLMGISMLVGGFGGIALVTLFAASISGLESDRQIWISLAVFLVMYILFSVYFCLKSRWADKMNSMRTSVAYAAVSIARNSFSFGRSLVKTLLCNILPEMLKNYVTNVIIVLVFTCFTTFGLHPVSVLALFGLFGWSFIEDAITGLLTKLVTAPLPFCGKNCPISGIPWFFATLSMMAFMGIGAAYSLTESGTSEVQYAMLNIPFAAEWWNGASVWTLLQTDFAGFFGELIHLFLLCSLMALLQYLSSSYLATLFTQVIGRIVLIMGLMMVVLALFNLFGTLIADYVLPQIPYQFILGFIGVLLLVILIGLQPYVMLQGLLTTIGFLVLVSVIPGAAVNGEGWDLVNHYLGAELILLGVNLLFSLIQNLVAFFEKKAHKAASLATVAMAGQY